MGKHGRPDILDRWEETCNDLMKAHDDHYEALAANIKTLQRLEQAGLVPSPGFERYIAEGERQLHVLTAQCRAAGLAGELVARLHKTLRDADMAEIELIRTTRELAHMREKQQACERALVEDAYNQERAHERGGPSFCHKPLTNKRRKQVETSLKLLEGKVDLRWQHRLAMELVEECQQAVQMLLMGTMQAVAQAHDLGISRNLGVGIPPQRVRELLGIAEEHPDRLSLIELE